MVKQKSDDNSIEEDDWTITCGDWGKSDIALVKTAEVNGNGQAGDTITYTFEVTNTGFTPIYGGNIDDTRINTNIPFGYIAPGDSITLTFDYVITSDDMEDGLIKNQAKVEGYTPNGSVTDLSDDNSTLEDDPTIVKLEKDDDCCCANNDINIGIKFSDRFFDLLNSYFSNQNGNSISFDELIQLLILLQQNGNGTIISE